MGSPLKTDSPPRLRRGCWAEGPAGVVAGLSIKAALWSPQRLRTTPTAAACCCLPLLIQGGERCFHRMRLSNRQQSLLNIPSSEAWRVSAEVRSPSPPTRLPRWREGAQLITQFLPGFALQHWNSLMPVNPPAPDVSVNTSVATASETIEARRGTDR